MQPKILNYIKIEQYLTTFSYVFILGFRYRFLIKRHNIASLRHEVRRQRRNNVLLLLIVSSYAISWLPFNILYTVSTYANQYRSRTGN